MMFLHAGDHIGMTATTLLSHLFEPDHVAFVLISVAVGVWCYHAGRRAEARAIATKPERRP